MTHGALDFDKVDDFVETNLDEIWVEFIVGGKTERFELEADNDWVDPSIFCEMQRRLVAVGSWRRFADISIGQSTLMICQSPENIKALNRLTGHCWDENSDDPTLFR